MKKEMYLKPELSSRQQEIVQASVMLISEKGIQGLTIKNLSKEIGISEPAIYRHFANKFDILSTLINTFGYSISSRCKVILNADIDSLSKLKNIFSSTLTSLVENPTFISVIFAEEIFQNEKKLSNKLFEIQENKERVIVNLLKELKTDKVISNDVNPENIAIIILGTIRMLARKWRKENYTFNLIEKGNSLLKEILNLIIIEEK